VRRIVDDAGRLNKMHYFYIVREKLLNVAGVGVLLMTTFHAALNRNSAKFLSDGKPGFVACSKTLCD
jgi:hypothetical protein